MNSGNIPIKSAFLLIGSPRGLKSVSNYLGKYLLNQLEQFDIKIDSEIISEAKKNKDDIITRIFQSDLFILSSPLYVDSFPAPVIEFLTWIEEKANNLNIRNSRNIKILFLTNCGFPESLHCENSIDQTQFFAETTGFEWLGGFALGGGEPFKYKKIGDNSGMTRNVRKALNLLANSIYDGKDIPIEVKELMAKSFIPIPFYANNVYRLAGNRNWKNYAKKVGTLDKLKDKPYEIID